MRQITWDGGAQANGTGHVDVRSIIRIIAMEYVILLASANLGTDNLPEAVVLNAESSVPPVEKPKTVDFATAQS